MIHIPDQSEVLRRYGGDRQSLIAAEELAELIQAISKRRRIGSGDVDTLEAYDNLIEEIADTLICIHQLQEMYNIFDAEIQRKINQKWKRMEARMHDADRRIRQE